MAPAVIIIGCLLVTISCLTTAQTSTTPSGLATDTTTTTSITSLPSTTPPTPAPTTTTTVHPPTLTGQSSNVTSIPVTTRPGVTSTTATTTTQTPVRGSCANPDLCCSGLNSSCHRLNCFCDVACLRLHDCCPDFKPTCLTVNNSTNSTQPNSTFPLTGTCSHPTLCCSGTDFSCFRGCFCDEACKQLNDCCPDLNSTCIFNSTTADPPFDSTADPPFDSTADPPFDSTADPPFISTAAPPKVLTVLDAKVKTWSTEEERQTALLQVGTVLENFLRVNNIDIYSFKVTKIKRVSP